MNLFTNIKKKEKRILGIKKEIAEKEKEISKRSPMPMETIRLIADKENTILKTEMDCLEREIQYSRESRRDVVNWVIVLMTLTALTYNIKVYNQSVQENEKINRPYLSIENPVIEFYDEKGSKSKEGDTVEKIKYVRLSGNKKNYGNLPAEILSEYTSIQILNFVSSSTKKLVIYDNVTNVTDYIPMQDFLDAFQKNNNQFIVEQKIDYRIIGSNKIYHAHTISTCQMRSIGMLMPMACMFQDSGTD